MVCVHIAGWVYFIGCGFEMWVTGLHSDISAQEVRESARKCAELPTTPHNSSQVLQTTLQVLHSLYVQAALPDSLELHVRNSLQLRSSSFALEFNMDQVTVKWIADDSKHYFHGRVQKIPWDTIQTVNNRNVDSESLFSLQAGDLLTVSTWPMWTAVVVPMDSADAAPPAKKQ